MPGPRWSAVGSLTDPRDTLAELWSVAIVALEATTPMRPTALHLAAYGHRNASSILQRALDEASECPAAGDCPGCDNEPATPCPYTSPERERLRVALAAVVAFRERCGSL